MHSLGPELFEERSCPRPSGYPAQTVLYFGGTPVTALLDWCATSSAIPEEIACMLVSRTLAGLEQGEIKQEDRLYPITRMERYTRPTKVVGVGSSSGMETRYALHLRAEFVPDGRHSGSGEYPIRDIYMKVLLKGSANVAGILLGFPCVGPAAARPRPSAYGA